MKDDAKSLSFVEDTAVPPERLRDYIARFLGDGRARTAPRPASTPTPRSAACTSGPVINLKTEEGVRRFEAIANDVADLVLEFGGALSGEHGDGLVRSPFIRKMFGPVLYDAFRTIKQTFDPAGLLQPGQDRRRRADDREPALRRRLRDAAPGRPTSTTTTTAASAARSRCAAASAPAARRSRARCARRTWPPATSSTRTRGRANVLRLAMTGRLGDAGLDDRGVYETLDLCLECRACKAECPVGVDMARFKSEFLAGYWQRHGTSLEARALGNARALARLGSAFAPLSNAVARSAPGRAAGRAAARHRPPAAAAGVPAAHAQDRAPRGAIRAADRRPLPLRRHLHQLLRPRDRARRARRARGRGRARGAGAATAAAAGRRSPRDCSATRARWPRPTRSGSTTTPRPAGRSCSASRAACRPCARTRRRCCAARRGARPRSWPGASVLFEEYAGRPGARAAARAPARRRCCSTATATSGRWAWSPPAKALLVAHSRRHGRGRRGRLLRHGRLVRLRARSLRGLARHRRAAALSGRAQRAARAPWSSPPAPRAVIRFTISPASTAVHPAVLLRSLLPEGPAHEPGLAVAGRARPRDDRELRLRNERRRPRAGAGVAGRRLRRRPRTQRGAERLSRCSSFSRWPA